MEFEVDGDNQSCSFKDVLECSATDELSGTQLTDVLKEKAIQCSGKRKYGLYYIELQQLPAIS